MAEILPGRCHNKPLNQQQASIYDDDLTGRVSTAHKAEISLGNVLRLTHPSNWQSSALAAKNASRCSSVSRSHIGVRTIPGATTFTRTGASSTAMATAKASTAEEMLAPMAKPTEGRRGTVLEVNTIDPSGRISLLACFVTRKAPQNRTSKKAFASSSLVSPSERCHTESPAV
jgi:hypothetical protein